MQANPWSMNMHPYCKFCKTTVRLRTEKGSSSVMSRVINRSKTDCGKIQEEIGAISNEISGVESNRRTAQQSSSSVSDVKRLSSFPNNSR